MDTMLINLHANTQFFLLLLDCRLEDILSMQSNLYNGRVVVACKDIDVDCMNTILKEECEAAGSSIYITKTQNILGHLLKSIYHLQYEYLIITCQEYKYRESNPRSFGFFN
jgi:predicted nucleic-acid-binding Zn-ribbon protein